MRRLGNTTMGSWAASAEKRLAEQLENQDASACARKKTLKGGPFRAGDRHRADLAHRPAAVSALVAPRHWREPARAFGSFGAGLYGLWLRTFLWTCRVAGAGTLRFCDRFQRDAASDLGASAKSDQEAGATISRARSHIAFFGSRAGCGGDRWNDELHAGAGQTATGLEGNPPDRGASSGKRANVLCGHLWRRR